MVPRAGPGLWRAGPRRPRWMGLRVGLAPLTGCRLAGYDGLTVPQLRARMRTLEPAQLRALIAHERAHAGRDEVVAMFERRLAKVEGGG